MAEAPPGRPAPRPEVEALEGYHSPQVEVEVRLNTNESALPPPDDFVADLAGELSGIPFNRYPDRDATRLKSALASRYGLTPDWVFPANGSNEAIQGLLLAYGGPGRSVGVFEPTYALHAQIARTTATAVVAGRRSGDFSLDAPMVERLVGAERPDLLFLCSPNNPTGMPDPDGLVEAALEALAPHGGLLVVDEAYGQFTGRSAVNLLDEDRPLVVSRTFSKTWALAGLRLGYLLGPPWCMAEVAKVGLPYHLDAVKQVAGVLALSHAGEMEARVRETIAERERLAAAMSELPVTVWPSEANFLLFRPEAVPGHEVWRALLDRSVLVRDFSSTGSLEDCLRVTVGTREEDDRFLAVLGEVLL